MATDNAPPPARRTGLPATVVVLGLTSLLTDVGSEMIFPLLPVFLAEVLGARPAFLGLVEGAADTVASLLKLASGYAADRLPRRKPLVVFGYGLAGMVRPLVAAATAPWHVLAIRLTDRVGKGIRTAPRDALIVDAARRGSVGRAFGFHRAMDHAGAVVGPLVASALIGAGFDLRTVFWFAAIPSLASVAMVLAVREDALPRLAQADPSAREGKQRGLPRSVRTYLAILFVFSLGNSSDAFLLLRARDLSLPATAIPILWAVLHVTKLSSSYAGGVLSDRVPRTHVIIGGWFVYAIVYLGLSLATHGWHAWGLFAIYGVYYGLSEPAEKALVGDLAPAHLRGRAFGYYNSIIGATALPASLLTGWLWQSLSPQAALLFGASLAGLASLGLLLWRPTAALAAEVR